MEYISLSVDMVFQTSWLILLLPWYRVAANGEATEPSHYVDSSTFTIMICINWHTDYDDYVPFILLAIPSSMY
jgi:hypothetical protein